MTTINHQQAAVEGALSAMEEATGYDWHNEPATVAITQQVVAAAEPHLRAAWAAELGATFQSGERWNETYRKGLRTLQYENAYLDGVIDIIALLEGGAE